MSASDVNPFAITNVNMIAPMWIQTMLGIGTVTYRQASGSSTDADIALATSTIQSMYPEYPNFTATWTLVVTWTGVLPTNSDLVCVICSK